MVIRYAYAIFAFLIMIGIAGSVVVVGLGAVDAMWQTMNPFAAGFATALLIGLFGMLACLCYTLVNNIFYGVGEDGHLRFFDTERRDGP